MQGKFQCWVRVSDSARINLSGAAVYFRLGGKWLRTVHNNMLGQHIL